MSEPEPPEQELRDLALAALGFGVMSFQRLQVRRRKLGKELQEGLAGRVRAPLR
ncbi:MAG: hypothetical protein P8N02_07085 [Actinomycetota bacterium]|nr:hypothetical protein [Actinomycetota bacterium]